MIRYEWREPPLTIRSAATADPQRIGEALAALEDADGNLDIHVVPEAARDPASPMHNQFTWDDAEAARERRLDQARNLVRSIRIVATGNEPPRPAYFSVRQNGTTAYRTLDAVEQSASLQMRIWESALRDLKAFQVRYQRLTGICKHIEEAIKAAEAAMAPEPEDA